LPFSFQSTTTASRIFCIRQRNGELACEIPLIISNHPDSKRHADFYHIPCHVIPVTKENKPEAEQQELELLRKNNIDLIVLARYMQVLSTDFIRHYPQQIINIHHSFLPAFVGAKPHHQAYERGVKLIAATAHYVTEVLDDGPIIEQGVARISHRDTLEDLVEKSRDMERVALSRAVRWHIENCILLGFSLRASLLNGLREGTASRAERCWEFAGFSP
jgi:formyltetrahydrofolate deformylase